MNTLGYVAHMLSVDAAFRHDFGNDPNQALAARNIVLEADAKAALANVRELLSLSPRDLAGRLLSATNDYANWGGFTLEPEAAAPLPL